ncbi:MAG: hypothetical protein WC389_12920 [Lutibacter sp.]|jgi:hypothetical protein
MRKHKTVSNIINLKDYKPKISEAQLKKSIQDYLQVLENQGVLYWDRLNSGELLVLNKDESKRLVKLCRKGTADIIILFSKKVIYLETKKLGGEQGESQKEFEFKVKNQGAEYYLVDTYEKFLSMIDQEGIV